MSFRLGIVRQVGALMARPSLLLEAIRSAVEMRGSGSLLPSKAYVEWRAQTAYGSSNAAGPTADLVHYLEWRRQMRRIRKGVR